MLYTMTDKIQFNNNKYIILIDTSYYVFYRYFATMRWFSFQKKDFNVQDIHQNNEFIDFFIKHFESDMIKICKKWKTCKTNIIFCSDCQRCDIWRNDLYKDYKGNRIQNSNFNGNIFTIFYDYILNNNYIKISIDRLEADDVIYLSYKQLKNITNHIVIITNDNDYLQLTDGTIQIINMQFKDITQRGDKNPMINLYFKAIYGDKSDNIQKITSISKEKAQNLANTDKTELLKWLENNNLIDKFNFNMNLISFENIPCEFVKKFNKKIKFVVE